MTLVVLKVNEHQCRAVIATNFARSFCGSGLIKSLKLAATDLEEHPAVASSDGTPIEFLGQTRVQLELGPWQSDGLVPLLIAFECPADVLIGQDLIDEISRRFPVKFEFYKNAVNIGGTRVSMLDPLAAEEKFISVRVVDPRSNEEIGLESWKKGVREEMGGLVKRRVEVIGGSSEDRSSGKEGSLDEEGKKDEAEELEGGRMVEEERVEVKDNEEVRETERVAESALEETRDRREEEGRRDDDQEEAEVELLEA